MPKIHQSLPYPEEGWLRFNDDYDNIFYEGEWERRTDSSGDYWRDSYTRSRIVGDYISFSFIGSGIRLLAYSNSNMSSSVKVILNGKEHYLSLKQASGVDFSNYVFFEEENLKMGNHEIKIINNSSSWIYFTAVDTKGKGGIGKSSNKTLILTEGKYKKLVLTEGIEKRVNMEEGSTVNISSNTWTVGNLIKLNRDLKLNMVGYYTGASSSIGIRIYDSLTSDVIFSGDRVSTIQGWNYFDISDLLLQKDREYVVGFYGNIIHGRTLPLPTIYHSINNDFSMTVIERRQATTDTFPSIVSTVYLPIIELIGVLKEDEIKEWEAVSTTLPTLPQFQEEGMEDLSILDRKIQQVLDSPQQMTSEELGEGKVFKGKVDLKKYFDLRKLEVK